MGPADRPLTMTRVSVITPSKTRNTRRPAQSPDTVKVCLYLPCSTGFLVSSLP